MAERDTIAAIITPPGEGGIGAIRIAGPETPKIVKKIFEPIEEKSHQPELFMLRLGYVIDKQGNKLDQITLVEMPEGRSYTGERQAEIFCHGGQYVLRKILEILFEHGARHAEPGEFTRLAFLAGKIDLARAEAVADIISSKTEYAYKSARDQLLGNYSGKVNEIRNRLVRILADIEAAVDYPEEDIESSENKELSGSLIQIIHEIKELENTYRSGRIIREGYKIAIAGRTNAGKSSLFNLFLGRERAIVAATPGTTRDYLSEWIDIDGMAVEITDTAGLRKTRGRVEKVGQKTAREIIAEADLVIWIVDITREDWLQEAVKDIEVLEIKNRILLALNKIDKIDNDPELNSKGLKKKGLGNYVFLSCKNGNGFEDLRKKIKESIDVNMPDLTDRLIVTSERHKQKLGLALDSLKKAQKGLKKEISPELIAFDMRRAVNEIDEITGRIYNEEILENIFSRFCIGK